jgi:lipid II isoglutaminyl synthase (glutamine-hydrolysing)
MNKLKKSKNFELKIGWLYPELMSTYGDRGNVVVLKRRCEWRDIGVEVIRIDEGTTITEIETVDVLFGGGAQDREQEIVMKNLKGLKVRAIRGLIERNVPALFVCGSPQLMGKYYEPAEGKRIEGLGIFDMVTKQPERSEKRCIGNIVVKTEIEELEGEVVVGFENHGGRTFLGKGAQPFGKVLKGFGNNGEDGTEGVVYKNAIGTYLHGPLLPKNVGLADFIIRKALENKYREKVALERLDDEMEMKARMMILKRLGVDS